MSFKLNISDPKTGRAKQVVVEGPQARMLVGLKIGDVVDGSPFGLPGTRLRIVGGSDRSGFPMRGDIPGGGKHRILLSGPPGFHPKKPGMRKRVTVRGNTITEDIVQINAVVEEGA
jgi:small subunit ribosomal protein S6e